MSCHNPRLQTVASGERGGNEYRCNTKDNRGANRGVSTGIHCSTPNFDLAKLLGAYFSFATLELQEMSIKNTGSV